MLHDDATFLHFTTANDSGTLGGAGSSAKLVSASVNTSAASAVLTIRVKDTNGATIAIIDASAKGSYVFGLRSNQGIFAKLTGGNADCTVVGG